MHRRAALLFPLLGMLVTAPVRAAEQAQPAVVASPSSVRLPPVAITDGYGGVCYANYYGENNRPFYPLMYAAGARHDRVDFRWDAIHDAGYDYRAWDSIVNDARTRGIEVTAILWATPAVYRKPGCNPNVGLTHGVQQQPGERPPGWYAPEVGRLQALATIQGSDPGACPPKNLYNPWTVENFNNNHWAEFVYRTVTHFKGRVRTWEIWNEVEWNWFWLGTPEEYAQLLKVAYQAVKAADPQATVLFAGLHYWAKPAYYEQVLDILNDDPQAAANNYYFDVMSVHLYARVSTIYDIPRQIREKMRLYISDHPIWLTETGVPVYDGRYPGARSEYSARETEAASYLIQSWANARAAGVERYYWFRAHDDIMAEHFGLTHDENYLRPAYDAYQVAARYLISPTMVTSVNHSGGVRRVTFWGTPHGKISVLWNESPTQTTFAYPATLSSATLVDQRGVTRTITPNGGNYSIVLPGATATRQPNTTDYIIGGEPYLIIERDVIPPTTVLTPLARRTYSSTIPVSWQATDDLAGIWGTEVQVRTGAGGAWQDWLSLRDTQGITTAAYAAAGLGQRYCFRVRAWDRAGNRVEWGEAPQHCTMAVLTRTVHLELPGACGRVDPFEIEMLPHRLFLPLVLTDGPEKRFTWPANCTPLTVSLRLVDADGVDVVTPTVSTAWEFTATLTTEEHTLWATPLGWWSPPPGWLPAAVRFTIPPGEEVYVVELPVLELAPHRASLWLPLVTNGYR